MTDSMIVEAIRAVKPVADDPLSGAAAPAAVADPSAVARFQAAMAPDAVHQVDPVPFASEVSHAWRNAQANNQGILHRIKALVELGHLHGPASGELLELQYEVMNLSFQQEVVSKVADKTSTAIQTLIKNQ
jgi:type III secretion system YscI/HrpB-like protein